MDLDTPVGEVDKIGPGYVKKLEKLGIKEVRDLHFHFPSRYEDYSNVVPIKSLKKGQEVTIRGHIVDSSDRVSYSKKLKILEAIIEDSTDSIKAIWFNQNFLRQTLEGSTNVLLSGKVSLGKGGLYLSNPIYEIERDDAAPIHTSRLVPIYPETRGLTSRWLRYAISKVLPLVEHAKDPLPKELVKEKGFLNIKDALISIHFPADIEAAKRALERFRFEELFYIQLAALKTKLEIQKEKAPKIKTDVALTKKFVNSLPFKLTDSQKKSSWTILKDMERAMPMNRLLEGDVGSGKTVVGAIAALNTIKSGFQVGIMAPTEILAEQHFRSFVDLFSGLDIKIALFTRNHIKKFTSEEEKISKENLKKEISEGKVDLVIGTHSLTQEGVHFKKLGLIVIDEQHRFGVAQRATLVKQTNSKTKTPIPHLLSMTATPIPRSLALTIYGDLDLSLLREMPSGRKKVITQVVAPSKKKEAYAFIKKELDRGRQAFVIFPLIEASEKVDAKSAKEEFEKLSTTHFKNYKLELLHGKVQGKEKERIMKDMQDNKIHMLVATSVIEVGIDVQNATIMMVDGAERFGLAQLHQFRGRVGRDKHQSYFMVLSASSSATTLSRLEALKKAKNGFELAEHDLALRGAGDLYGIRQSGMPDLAMSSLHDIELIEDARESANKLLEKDSELAAWPALQARVQKMQEIMHFE